MLFLVVPSVCLPRSPSLLTVAFTECAQDTRLLGCYNNYGCCIDTSIPYSLSVATKICAGEPSYHISFPESF